jgi:hypothetical protein
VASDPAHECVLRSTNPHVKTESTILRLEIYLEYEVLSIFLTNLHQVLSIPALAINRFGRSVRAGGRTQDESASSCLLTSVGFIDTNVYAP